MNKKAITLTPNEIIELILVIAGMFLLIVAFLAFTNPGFDVNKETAKSYLATLEREIQKVDDKKTGDFEMWMPEKDAQFFLIYFGNKRSYIWNKIEFKRKLLSFGKNNVCICYVNKNKPSCEDCISLGYLGDYSGLPKCSEIEFEVRDSTFWATSEETRYYTDSYYKFDGEKWLWSLKGANYGWLRTDSQVVEINKKDLSEENQELILQLNSVKSSYEEGLSKIFFEVEKRNEGITTMAKGILVHMPDSSMDKFFLWGGNFKPTYEDFLFTSRCKSEGKEESLGWMIKEGERVQIKKQNNRYVFTRV